MSMPPSPFGLHPTRSRVAAQRVTPGAAFTLGQPVVEGGVTLFRQSLWLAVPVAARGAVALQLAASALALRFEPITLDVPTDDRHWFDDVVTEDDNKTVRIEWSWPATVTALPDPTFVQHHIGFDLYRADGDRRADEPTQTGQTGSTLSPPWVGSPMVVVMQQAVLPTVFTETLVMLMVTTPADTAAGASVEPGPPDAAASPDGAAAAQAASPAAQGSQLVQEGARAAVQMRRQRSHVVPTVTLRGVPTSPRARLVMEARGDAPETLLWLAMLPGEQATVTLPQQSVADEWAPALEQVRKRLADEAPALDSPVLLRLDLESDAPCSVTLTQAALALDGEFEALSEEARVDFDGTRVHTQALPLVLPSGNLQGLRLAGRVDGGTAADAGAAASLPADLRRGLLLTSPARVLVHTVLDEPTRVGGLSLAWHPLSDAVALTLRLLGDAADTPSAAPLLELPLRADTPAPGWLALRSAEAIDLQARHLWLELTVNEGSGLWLADPDAPLPTQGCCEPRDAPAHPGQPLGVQPALAWLPPPRVDPVDAPALPRGVALLAGNQGLAAALAERFELDAPASLLPVLASQGLQAQSGSAARLTLVSARARLRLA